MGEWHTHPACAPVPSTRDLATYKALSTDPDLDFAHGFVALIAAPSSHTDGGWLLAAWDCRGDTCRPLLIEHPADFVHPPPISKASRP
ncbi:hypothetical protein [Nocardia brasiliensis]|uniref:hypothetical protein n=1 Tax=Nocardia brasiliensis TaxID=37326 RepID=UPI003D76F3BF